MNGAHNVGSQSWQAIEQKLVVAGWLCKHMRKIVLSAGGDVIVRKYQTDTCPTDYVLFVQRRAVGVVVTGDKTLCRCHVEMAKHSEPLPFLFEATSQIIRFTDGRELHLRSRESFTSFYREH
jgi:type I restriction enzyme R subunit